MKYNWDQSDYDRKNAVLDSFHPLHVNRPKNITKQHWKGRERELKIPLINRQRGRYKDISDRGQDFPVMTERTRLISYLLYGLSVWA